MVAAVRCMAGVKYRNDLGGPSRLLAIVSASTARMVERSRFSSASHLAAVAMSATPPMKLDGPTTPSGPTLTAASMCSRQDGSDACALPPPLFKDGSKDGLGLTVRRVRVSL